MKKFFLILIPMFAFLLLACGSDAEDTTQKTDSVNEQIESEEKSIVGSWTGTWIQDEVHYETELPEGNCEDVEYWDPESHKSEGGVDWPLQFYINEENSLNIVNGGEGKIVFKSDYEFSFETEWNCNRVVKWSGNFSEDFENIEGHWEIHHPIYELMSSGTWNAGRF
jgi:hypothetical protein